jgi:transposase
MEITAEQYERIQECLPVQRGNVRHENLVLLNAILYVAEHGCKWRGLPKRYGNWHSIYVRMNRWAKKGVLDQVLITCSRRMAISFRKINARQRSWVDKFASSAGMGSMEYDRAA